MPTSHSASRDFLTALDVLCRDQGVNVAEALATAGDIAARHLEELAGLPRHLHPAAKTPLATAISSIVKQFRWSLSETNADAMELSPLLLQTLFESALDGEIKFHQGVVYTPLESVRLVLEAGFSELEHAGERPLRIADPAAGSGAFLVQLAKRCSKECEIYGLDSDCDALGIARQRLNLLGATSNSTLPPTSLLEGTAQDLLLARAPFDMIVGNPPYVRHEGRVPPAKELTDRLTRALSIAPSDRRIARLIAGRADLYATFFLLGLAAVRPGGIVAYITSDSWLDTRFGEDLQSIALEQCDRISLHAEPNQRSFRRTGINTVISVMRRAPRSGKTTVRFIPSPNAPQSPSVISPEPGKWAARYLRGGAISRLLQCHPHMVRLGSVARLTYGNKPGIRQFFVLPAERARNLVDERFLKPVLASSKEILNYAVNPEELSHCLFVCPHSVEELERLGYPLTLSWVEGGASMKTTRGALHTRGGIAWPEVRSVQNNRPEWHCLTTRPPGDFVVPALLGNRLFVAHNDGRVDNTNAFFHGSFSPDIDPLLGLGLLNSSVTYLLFEIYGRPKGLGGLNLYGPELRLLPIPDPKRLTSGQRHGIIDSFWELRSRPIRPLLTELGDGTKAAMPEDRRALDQCVFEALGLSPAEGDALYEELRSMTMQRLAKGRKS